MESGHTREIQHMRHASVLEKHVSHLEGSNTMLGNFCRYHLTATMRDWQRHKTSWYVSEVMKFFFKSVPRRCSTSRPQKTRKNMQYAQSSTVATGSLPLTRKILMNLCETQDDASNVYVPFCQACHMTCMTYV